MAGSWRVTSKNIRACAWLPSLCFWVLATVIPVSAAERITLAGDDNIPPYSSEVLPSRGLLNSLVDVIFREAGYEPDILLLPWSRALNRVETVSADALIGAFYTEDRAKRFYYSDPFFEADVVLLTRRESVFHFERLQDLKGMRVGVVQDNAYPGSLRDVGLDVLEVADFRLNLRMLTAQRVDVIADVVERLRYAAVTEDYDWSDFRVLKPKLGSGVMHVAVSKQHPNASEILTRFNTALARLRASGRYQQLIDQAAYE